MWTYLWLLPFLKLQLKLDYELLLKNNLLHNTTLTAWISSHQLSFYIYIKKKKSAGWLPRQLALLHLSMSDICCREGSSMAGYTRSTAGLFPRIQQKFELQLIHTGNEEGWRWNQFYFCLQKRSRKVWWCLSITSAVRRKRHGDLC